MSNTTNIKILDKEYQVSCPPDERIALLDSARVLDQRMRNIKNSGSVLGLERIAVMAGLNLTYDLMKVQQDGAMGDEAKQRLQDLNNTLDDALQQFENAELF
ncbi:cell division protein ZapA [Porticoccus sp. W117]|uniref:cell division protein ZapA n=1 Tax=Porticoccus sp. W117 TaxID=3054777 RepID=UPI0025965B4E|nr:cell division protein ZapA [Porticoccus sp. W117]MDM3872029.1 cell division protein ZapA [Porticoccus sp. W117]